MASIKSRAVVLSTLKIESFLTTQAVDQFCGRIHGDDATMIEDGYPVAQAFSFFHVVGGQQDGLAFRSHIAHQIPDGMPGLWVQACGQLIQEDKLWVGEQCQCDEKALLLPTG